MSIAVTEPLRIFGLVTAFVRSCVVPTLFGGNTASRAASPTGVQPRTATNRAVIDRTDEPRLDILFPFVGVRVEPVSSTNGCRNKPRQRQIEGSWRTFRTSVEVPGSRRVETRPNGGADCRKVGTPGAPATGQPKEEGTCGTG